MPVDVNAMPQAASHEAIVGRSRPMQDVYKAIGRVSSSDATVLVRGESGTGKELVARAIYQHSLRAEKTFHVINCVAIPENLLESELFGYEKGAFTGAAHRKIGKIEQANKGTIFLDEIGDMPFSIQAKILRLLQEKSIERLGGRETIPVDVRIIAATNRNLEEALNAGRFREDLYYRLKVVTIWLPPLRDRKSDISLLSEYFLSNYADQNNIENPGITEKAIEKLREYPWPGNVRELGNTIQKALIFNRGAPISAEDIGIAIESETQVSVLQPQKPEDLLRQMVRHELKQKNQGDLFDVLMDQYASIIISEALVETDGNRSQASKLLGLSRPTLHSKIDKYQLKFRTSVQEN
jgi:transcriptional regulator with PAS, ATPase and Fis domain